MSGFGMQQTSDSGTTNPVFGGGSSFGSGPLIADGTSIDGSTPWVAASDGNLPLLQQSLVVLNIPIDAADENGYTLLQAAASYNHVAVLQWILSEARQKQQIDQRLFVNALDNEGDSALHYAGGRNAAKFLIEEAQIDIQLRNRSGQTALEAKKDELNELEQDEDYEEDDIDAINLKSIIGYITSLSSIAQ